MTQNRHIWPLYVIAIAALVMSGLGLYKVSEVDQRSTALTASISGFKSQLTEEASSTAALTAASIGAPSAGGPIPAPAKSQDQLLTTAVAKTAPAVVSIVISKAVPDLEVSYVNPFGSDPLFKDIGVRIPVYHERGTTVQKIGAGTGFIISHDGYILTNQHVVSDPNADYTVLLANGAEKTATVAYRDTTNDVAIIKISGNYPTVAVLGNSAGLKLGSTVIAIGNALGEYNNSVSVGIVSGLNRDIDASDPEGGSESLSGMIQTDASINPGNSGGPLLDLSGNVVAMNVATVYGSNNIGFSIPIDMIKGIIAKYI